MKYLKKFENFNVPHIPPVDNPHEDLEVDYEDVELLKKKEEVEKEEQDAIESLAAGFMTNAPLTKE